MMLIRALVVVLLIMASVPAWAVNVRGRVDFVSANGTFPMARATVQFCRGNSCSEYVTGNDGMYYLNVAAGTYVVRVNGTEKKTVEVKNYTYFDVAAFRGN